MWAIRSAPVSPSFASSIPSSLQLEAPVNQTDAALFEVGQLATVGFDAYPGIEFRGRVTSIGALSLPCPDAANSSTCGPSPSASSCSTTTTGSSPT
jgi:hypothetical protein